MKRLGFSAIITLVTVSASAQPVLPFGDQGWRTDWSKTSIDYAELEVNVRRDQIPPIDFPRFVSTDAAARWLEGKEPVVLVRVGEVARAYPLQILTWHEIVNDRLADTPVSVTFCPLCYSAIAFSRRVGDEVLDFGVSGMLRHSDLVMYDRQTHSLWQQLTGEGIAGTHTGGQLERVPAQIISFDQFKEAHPHATVLSRETGHQRPYGKNPYVGYDDIDQRPWLFRGSVDERLPPMEKVVGVEIGDASKAYAHSDTRRARVIHDRVGGVDLVVFHARNGATSALDGDRIADSRVIGSTGVFQASVDGQLLQFEAEGPHFKDEQTGTIWDVTGRAIEGALEGKRLRPVEHADVFAFAWFVMMPETELFKQ